MKKTMKKSKIKSLIAKLKIKQILNSNIVKKLGFAITVTNSIVACGKFINFPFVNIYGPIIMLGTDSIHTNFSTNFKSTRLPLRLNQIILIQEIFIPSINIGSNISLIIFFFIIIYKVFRDKNIKNIKDIPIKKYILEASTISALTFFLASVSFLIFISTPSERANLFRIPTKQYVTDFNFHNRNHALSVAKQELLRDTKLMRRIVMTKNNREFHSIMAKIMRKKSILMKENPMLSGENPILKSRLVAESLYANLLRDQCRHEALNYANYEVIIRSLIRSRNLTEEIRLYLLSLLMHHNIQMNLCCELLIKASSY